MSTRRGRTGGQPNRIQHPRVSAESHFDNIHCKRFVLVEAAPICNGELRRAIGYNATMDIAMAILAGTYEYPPNFDQATREIFKECTRIQQMIPKDAVRIHMNKEEWQYLWRSRKEATSSSVSGLHFGHYIAGTWSNLVSHFHALKATLVTKQGIVLNRWSRGLSVMLEKMFGCALITKLRSILLMEVDFNAANIIVFGQCMLDQARNHNLIPEEIYSKTNRLAEDGTLTKVIFYDIVQQLGPPTGIAAVDADNCYDRIAHPIASMVFQAMGVPINATVSMLSTIQDMIFFLQMGFGDSKAFAGTTGEVKMQSLCQGNGAALAGWLTTNITMIRAHKRNDHSVHLINPITDRHLHVVGTIYVGDTNLKHFDMCTVKNVEDAHANYQESIRNWGCLLIATGGALKPIKCFYHLISFSWKTDRSWSYENNHENPEYSITVLLEDGSSAEIEHLDIDTPTKTLGLMTAPTGSNAGALAQMKENAEGWLAKASGAKLHKCNMWFLLDKQFWPTVAYGIHTISAPFKDLNECLMRTYYKLLPRSGVRKSIRR
jgi:hypothetical protein